MGGAERWYRNLAVRLAEEGHEVVYLTMRQWDASDEPDVPGVRVIAVAPRMALYDDGGRRILPPLRFGLGVLGHLLRHGRRYDVVHTASFPYFSAAGRGTRAAARPVPPGGRLARALDARVLEQVPRPSRRRGRLARAAALPADIAARLLLLATGRAAPAGRGGAWQGDRARGAVRRTVRQNAASCRAGGRLRGTSHPGEESGGRRARASEGKGNAARTAGARSTATGRSAGRFSLRSTSSGSRRWSPRRASSTAR